MAPLLFNLLNLLNISNLQTKTHVCLITNYCPRGELFLLLDRQPTKVLKEDAVRYIILPLTDPEFLFDVRKK